VVDDRFCQRNEGKKAQLGNQNKESSMESIPIVWRNNAFPNVSSEARGVEEGD
jgi:hypothetical protein